MHRTFDKSSHSGSSPTAIKRHLARRRVTPVEKGVVKNLVYARQTAQKLKEESFEIVVPAAKVRDFCFSSLTRF